MNTRKNETGRLKVEIVNAGVPPCGDQVPPPEKEFNYKQASVNPPPLTDGDIRVALIQ